MLGKNLELICKERVYFVYKTENQMISIRNMDIIKRVCKTCRVWKSDGKKTGKYS